MVGTYDSWLVILSIVVAVSASYVALALVTRVTASADKKAAHYWLVGGALSMGTGIWSMHFIGMLAFRLPIAMSYDIPITLLSLLIAAIVSGFALYTVSSGTMNLRRLIGAGVLMGLGIASMHYTGMAAMQMEPPISYDKLLFILSILIAIVASLAALWIAFQLRLETNLAGFGKKIGSALVMGAAISGMHYTAMAAANFEPNSICSVSPQYIDHVWLANTIGGFTVAFLATTLLISVFDAKLTERKKAEVLLTQLAQFDSLTGLPNRVLFRDRLALAMARAKRNEQLLAVVFIDLDRFKEINDSLGHPAGDEVLQAVAGLLRNLLREVDTIARLGGDEFTLILENVTHIDQIAVVAEKILRVFSEPIVLHRREIFVTASLGITIYPRDAVGVDTLLQSADIAMYHAKDEGRNTYEFYAPEMNAHAIEDLNMENLLRRALERGEFLLHYQPKVSLKNGRIVGVEALIRWNSKEQGLISPARFIPLAEATGLIVPIGEWVLKTASAQNKAWQDLGLPPLLMSVNLSPRQFRQKTLLDTLTAGMQSAGLDSRFLEFEITESVIMRQGENAIAILQALHKLGIQISIDDFGTGYSSLAYLKRFPVHTLKIDQSFMRDLTIDGDGAGIVTAVIAMSKSLGLKVVAEGVETEEQLACLTKLNCDEYQGYYFSRPLPADEFRLLFQSTLQASIV